MRANFRKQNGAVFLMMMLVLILAVSTFILTKFDNQSLKIERDRKTAIALAEAKSALIGYFIKHKNVPCPDKSTDDNYDGSQDAPCVSVRIGRFPYANVEMKDNFVDGIALDLRDGYGERLWYAVSGNLVDLVCRPDFKLIQSLEYSIKEKKEGCPGKNLPYPWLSVFDRNANVLNSRVVAVVIAPGALVANQNRVGNLPSPSQYLDRSTINDVLFNNAAKTPINFISGVVARFSSIRNQNVIEVNDQIIFLTIDELIPLVESGGT